MLTPLNAGFASAFKLLKSGPWQGRLAAPEAQGLGVRCGAGAARPLARGAPPRRAPSRPSDPLQPSALARRRRPVPYRPDVSHVIPPLRSLDGAYCAIRVGATRPVAADCPLDALSLTLSRAVTTRARPVISKD